MEICKTDVKTVIRYLDDAARLYDERKGLRYSSRAYMLRRLVNKLNNKLNDKL